MYRLFIRAESVKEIAPGVFQIDLPSDEVQVEDAAVISRLFPNLSEQVYEVLSNEALIAAMIPQAEAMLMKKRAGMKDLGEDWPTKVVGEMPERFKKK